MPGVATFGLLAVVVMSFLTPFAGTAAPPVAAQEGVRSGLFTLTGGQDTVLTVPGGFRYVLLETWRAEDPSFAPNPYVRRTNGAVEQIIAIFDPGAPLSGIPNFEFRSGFALEEGESLLAEGLAGYRVGVSGVLER